MLEIVAIKIENQKKQLITFDHNAAIRLTQNAVRIDGRWPHQKAKKSSNKVWTTLFVNSKWIALRN